MRHLDISQRDLPAPKRFHSYPHQQAIGMKQRRRSCGFASAQCESVKSRAERTPVEMKISKRDASPRGFFKPLHDCAARPVISEARANDIEEGKSDRCCERGEQPHAVLQSEFSFYFAHQFSNSSGFKVWPRRASIRSSIAILFRPATCREAADSALNQHFPDLVLDLGVAGSRLILFREFRQQFGFVIHVDLCRLDLHRGPELVVEITLDIDLAASSNSRTSVGESPSSSVGR